MAHDHHFLQRLDRATRAETDFALSLYRDHEALRYVLDAARLPPAAERVALEITPGGPHVIVQRAGQFVTCLGPGMSVGPHPVVTRARIDALLAAVADLRARREMAKAVERPGGGTGELFARIIERADNLSREELVAISGWQPLVAPRWYQGAFEGATTMLRQAMARPQPEYDANEKMRDGARAAWKLFWGIGHQWLLATMGSLDYLAEHTAYLAQEKKLTFSTTAAVLGSTKLSMRAWWGAARIGKPLVGVYKQHIASPSNGLDLADALIALTAIGLRHSSLRAEVRKTIVAPRTYDRDDLAPLVPPITTELARALDDPEAHAREFLDMAREHYLERTASLPEGSPLRFASEGDVPDDLARSVLLGCDMDLHGDPHAIGMGLAAVSTIAAAKVEDFYLPSDLERALRVEWTPARTQELTGRMLRYSTKEVPVRSSAKPGRNDPCSCGSGKKFKKCCGS